MSNYISGSQGWDMLIGGSVLLFLGICVIALVIAVSATLAALAAVVFYKALCLLGVAGACTFLGA